MDDIPPATLELSTRGFEPASARAEIHSWLEDAYAISISSSCIAFGVVLLKSAGLITGGMGGLALLLSYVFGMPATMIFAVLNGPFFMLSWKSLGGSYAIRSMVANAAIMGMGAVMPHSLALNAVDPTFSALFGGSIIGMGILALARHRAGVGDIGVMAQILQKSRGWNTGRTQLVCDVLIVMSSIPILSAQAFANSALSAVALSLVILVNHRPGRYITY